MLPQKAITQIQLQFKDIQSYKIYFIKLKNIYKVKKIYINLVIKLYLL